MELCVHILQELHKMFVVCVQRALLLAAVGCTYGGLLVLCFSKCSWICAETVASHALFQELGRKCLPTCPHALP